MMCPSVGIFYRFNPMEDTRAPRISVSRIRHRRIAAIALKRDRLVLHLEPVQRARTPSSGLSRGRHSSALDQ
jgi:hypothetical protein